MELKIDVWRVVVGGASLCGKTKEEALIVVDHLMDKVGPAVSVQHVLMPALDYYSLDDLTG